MATRASEARSSEAKARAETNFKKEERVKEGAKAMSEYQANGRVVREQMARLRALRLAKEAADKAAGEALPPPGKPAKAKAKKAARRA
ncbi:MAG: transcriptional regulator [Xanthobacteraceae bacterium]